MEGVHDKGLPDLLRTQGACWGPESESLPLKAPLAVQVLEPKASPPGPFKAISPLLL